MADTPRRVQEELYSKGYFVYKLKPWEKRRYTKKVLLQKLSKRYVFTHWHETVGGFIFYHAPTIAERMFPEPEETPHANH